MDHDWQISKIEPKNPDDATWLLECRRCCLHYRAWARVVLEEMSVDLNEDSRYQCENLSMMHVQKIIES